MIENNNEEALSLKSKFDKRVKNYPYIGKALSEKELMDIVDNLDKKRK